MISLQIDNSPVPVTYQTTPSLLHGWQSPNFIWVSTILPSNSRKLYPNWSKPITVIPFLLEWLVSAETWNKILVMRNEEKSNEREKRTCFSIISGCQKLWQSFAVRKGISLRTKRHNENVRTKKWKVIESLMASLITEVTNPEVSGLLFMWGDIFSLLFKLNYL